MKKLIKLVFLLPRKYIFLCFSIIIIALIMSASEVFVLYSIKPFIQSFSSDNLGTAKILDYQKIYDEALKFLTTIIVCGILRISLITFQYRIAALISAKISSDTFSKIINQEYVSLKSANQSKFLSIIIQDIQRASEAISNASSLISNVIVLSFISFSLLIIETKLFLISGTIISVLYVLILFIFGKRLRINGENITKYNHKEASLVRSTLASIVDFIIGDSYEKQLNEYKVNEIKLRTSYANTLIYSQSPRYIVETVCLGLFTCFIILSISNNSSLLIFAQLGTLLFAFNRALPAAQQLYSSYAFIKSTTASIKNVTYVLNFKGKNILEKSKLDSKVNKIENLFLKNGLNKLSIQDLEYSYEKSRKISYKNFIFEEGSPTAITGKSGTGKTTLIELILNLLKPDKGVIKLNNIDIKKVYLPEYYKNISYMSQSPFLFSGSLYENIVFGTKKDINKEELYKNGTKLGLRDEFGENFLDYEISDFGRNISGGQAQRCSLLKILSDIKPILIIDEPSSALDKKTSILFTKLLLEKAKNSILIVITHSEMQSDLFPNKLEL